MDEFGSGTRTTNHTTKALKREMSNTLIASHALLERLLVLIDEYELFTAVNFFLITHIALSFIQTHRKKQEYSITNNPSFCIHSIFQIKIEQYTN